MLGCPHVSGVIGGNLVENVVGGGVRRFQQFIGHVGESGDVGPHRPHHGLDGVGGIH